MIVLNVCNGDKVAVLIIDMMWVAVNFRVMLFSRHLIFASLEFRDFF